MAAGLDPISAEGEAVARAWLDASARAMRREPDAEFVAWQRAQYRKHHARSARYRELLTILRGAPVDASAETARAWVNAALRPVVGLDRR